MKKLFVALSLLTGLSSLQALDWGLNVNQVPLAMLGETTLYVGSLKTSAWANQPIFGADFRLQGEASFSASTTDGTWSWGTPSFDLTEASLKGLLPLGEGDSGLLEWSLGRRSLNDATGGWVLDSRWDGFNFNWLAGPSTISASLGYSGLLSKKSGRLAVSPADLADQDNANVTSAPQRVVGALGWGWNELLLRQDLRIEILGNYDLRSGASALHTAYGTLVATGPLPGGLRQKWHATGGLRIASAWTASYLAGGEVSATLPFLGSRLVIAGVASQGFGGHGFLPVSGKGLADVISVPTENAANLGADFSFKPLSKVTLGLKATTLFRTSLDLVGVRGFDSASSAYWLGTEGALYASWTPTSESSFGLNSGIFLPQSNAFVAGTKPTILAVVTATLKL